MMRGIGTSWLKRIMAMTLIIANLVCFTPHSVSAESTTKDSGNIPGDALWFNGHYYKLYTEKKYWHDAAAYCEQLGGHMLTITSAAENDFITEWILQPSQIKIAIGFTDEGEEGEWKWVTNETVTYTNWNRGEPNNENNEDYTVMRTDGTWNDGHLSREYCAFVCEWDAVENAEQKFDQEAYVQQHLSFVNSNAYSMVLNDYRYANILWENYHGNTSQAVAEYVYDIMEGAMEFVSFQEISSLKNPYDVIILDLISSPKINESVKSAVESETANIVADLVSKLKKLGYSDEEWTNDADIVNEFKDLLDTEPSQHASNKFYQSLSEFFAQQDPPSVLEVLGGGYKCFDAIVSTTNDAAKGIDYVLENLRYITAVEAYYNSSEEIKTILKEISEVMPNVHEHFAEEFCEAYNNYSACVDYDTITKNVLEHIQEESFWLITDLLSDVLQDSAITFCKTALNMTEAAAGQLVAVLWAAETGFSLGNLVTNNDTLMNCRRMLRANYMLDEAAYYVMEQHASVLREKQTFETARYFDAAFNIYKNLQISSLQYHQKYMEANGSSFVYFIAGKQEFFNSEAQAKAAIANSWKNITCHSGDVSDEEEMLRSNTVVVACPTDVYVYNKLSGELVASVVDNEVNNTDNLMTIAVESDVKAICAPSLDDYEIKIRATDAGTMTVGYTVNNLQRVRPERIVLFNDVKLNNESSFEFQLGTDDCVTLADRDQAIILPDVDTNDLTIKSTSLSLQHNLAINYKVNKQLLDEKGYSTPYILFERNGVESKVTEYVVSENEYVFTLRDIAPNQMNDTINATLCATNNGEVYSGNTYEYSVTEYCYNILNTYTSDEYVELQTLLVDLLNYGAMSQIYTGYRTDKLANDALTEEQQNWGTVASPTLNTVFDAEYKTVEQPMAQWQGAALNLQDSVCFRLRFSVDNVEDLSVVVESENATWTIPQNELVEKYGVYYVVFNGIHVGQMRDSLYFTIYRGDTAISNTVAYSVESYVYEEQFNEDENLVALIIAMMKYGDAARAYAST